MSRARALAVLALLALAGCAEPTPEAATTTTRAAAPAKPEVPEVRALTSPVELSGQAPPAATPPTATTLSLPDLELTNQRGEQVRLHALVEGKIVIIQTIFTSCGTICPPMGTNFSKLQELLADQPDVALISISIDPITDIPERLQAWGEKFGAGERWTLLTGSSQDIRTTLKALRTYTAEKQDHSSMLVIGHHGAGKWTRVDGLSEPAVVVGAVAKLRGELGARAAASDTPPSGNEIAHQYFTDVELVDQHGRKHRLYSDLLQGKVVIINSFFTSCQGVCPPLTQRLADLQTLLGARMGKELFILSLSVDPITDTPERLADYAEKYEAGEGWLFLAGDKANVDLALLKLGFAVEVREGHSNLFVIGNEATGLWKKAFGLAEPEQLLEVVESVLEDRGEPTPIERE